MISRRSLVIGAAALTAIAAARRSPGLASALDGAAASPWWAGASVALSDRLLEGSRAFAAAARAHGLRPLAFDSDVAGLWMRDIEPLFRAGPTAIAGYTGAATLFCLDLLARDFGARVRHRAGSSEGVVWLLSSTPLERAALAPTSSTRSRSHA